MTAYRPTFKPVPYSLEEKESMKRLEQENQDYDAQQLAKEQQEKVAEWMSNGKAISLHFDSLRKEIYWKIDGEFAGAAKVSGLRRPNAQELAQNADLHAVVDGSSRLGLTKERYMILRSKLA